MTQGVEIDLDVAGVLVGVDAEIAELAAFAAKWDVQIQPQRRVRAAAASAGPPVRPAGWSASRREGRIVGDEVVAEPGLFLYQIRHIQLCFQFSVRPLFTQIHYNKFLPCCQSRLVQPRSPSFTLSFPSHPRSHPSHPRSQATLVPKPPSFTLSFPSHPRSQATLVPKPPSFPSHPRSQATLVPKPPSFPSHPRSQATLVPKTLVPKPLSFPSHPRSQATLVPKPPSFPSHPRSQATLVPKPLSFPSHLVPKLQLGNAPPQSSSFALESYQP